MAVIPEVHLFLASARPPPAASSMTSRCGRPRPGRVRGRRGPLCV